MQLTNKASGNVISFYLKELKITQTELAKTLGVTQSAVNKAIHNYQDKYDSDLRQLIINFIKSKKLRAA